MSNISIFCKSYRNDLERAVAMAESVRRFNRDSLPLYISVPKDDLALFRDRIGVSDVIWLSDDDIINANSAIDLKTYKALPGHLSQQIVKAEFWRINPAENYLCIDSDCIFIRDFYANDFVAESGNAYTVLHEGKEFSHFCLTHDLQWVMEEFNIIQKKFCEYFGRQGPAYNFGPFPVIWNAKVWRSLEHDVLIPDNLTILDAINRHSSEAFWYGETLLKLKPIPVLPREPLFKAYLFFEEYEQDVRVGADETILAQNYLGIVYQSNWYPKRLRFFNKIAYKLKSRLRKLR